MSHFSGLWHLSCYCFYQAARRSPKRCPARVKGPVSMTETRRRACRTPGRRRSCCRSGCTHRPDRDRARSVCELITRQLAVKRMHPHQTKGGVYDRGSDPVERVICRSMPSGNLIIRRAFMLLWALGVLIAIPATGLLVFSFCTTLVIRDVSNRGGYETALGDGWLAFRTFRWHPESPLWYIAFPAMQSHEDWRPGSHVLFSRAQPWHDPWRRPPVGWFGSTREDLMSGGSTIVSGLSRYVNLRPIVFAGILLASFPFAIRLVRRLAPRNHAREDVSTIAGAAEQTVSLPSAPLPLNYAPATLHLPTQWMGRAAAVATLGGALCMVMVSAQLALDFGMGRRFIRDDETVGSICRIACFCSSAALVFLGLWAYRRRAPLRPLLWLAALVNILALAGATTWLWANGQLPAWMEP